MKKRLFGWIETAKTMVMILLFACVLCLLGVYISLLSDTWNMEDAYGDVVDKIHLLASGEHAGDYPEGSYLLPESILFTADGKSRMLSSAADGAMQASYEKAAELLSTIFSQTGAFKEVSVRTAANRWEEVMRCDSCLYITYHSELPVQIVGYFTAALTNTALRIDDPSPIAVKDVAVCEVEEGTYLAMIRSSSGSVYLCDSWESVSDFSTLYAHSLHELEKISASVDVFAESAFAGEYFEGSGLFASPVTPVLLVGTEAAKFRFLEPHFRMILEDKEDTKALLYAFSYNPNKINRHEEAAGTIVFIEDHGMLKVSDSLITYTAAPNGGISVSAQLGAAASDKDLYNAVLYATRVLNGLRAIRPLYFGGDCELLLDSVTGKNGRIELRFCYYADNLMIRNQPGRVVFVFDSDTLISAEIDGISGYNVADADHLYSGAWAAERFYSSIGTIDSMSVVYDYSSGTAVSAQWIATAAEGNGDT